MIERVILKKVDSGGWFFVGVAYIQIKAAGNIEINKYDSLPSELNCDWNFLIKKCVANYVRTAFIRHRGWNIEAYKLTQLAHYIVFATINSKIDHFVNEIVEILLFWFMGCKFCHSIKMNNPFSFWAWLPTSKSKKSLHEKVCISRHPTHNPCTKNQSKLSLLM